MQLIKLQILDGKSVRREIKFQDGINIITNSEASGNHIGKSTALRVINFCLGSDGENIWNDPDSRTTSDSIRKFVTSGNVTFVLYMNINGTSYCIKRRIVEAHQKTRTVLKRYSWINGNEYDTNDKFQEALAPLLGFSIESPTYSAIKNRFVRIDKTTSHGTYRYLNVHTSDASYISYYSYIFGFAGHSELSREIQLSKEKKESESRIAMLLNGKTEQDYKDNLKSIDDDIEILNQKEDAYDFKDAQNEGITRLKHQRKLIAQVTSEIARLEIRMNYARRTIANYASKQSDLDVNMIEAIYAEAKSLVPNLSKSLEEVINFHDLVIRKKSEYVNQQLAEYTLDRESKQAELEALLREEKYLIKAIFTESHLGGFIVIEKELQDKREERGRTSMIVDEIASEARKIKKLELTITKLRQNNQAHMSQLKTNVDVFNKECKEYTRALFKSFALSVNVDTNSATNELEFSIVNQEKVAGDGAPRAAALAFDMAFVEYVKKVKAKLPQFTLQDHLEAADPDKIATLARIANKKKIQVVMAILSDKLQSLDQKFIDDNTVLWLKQSDKFFKI
ncbi:DUF2326 domain-containing protein [Halovibrio sp. HP20-50]|uniref:DUF2326 domain-containing protein n=1 Tax=Halovibrio sp. HP20-59 TaxID=3080275 RepID=UPI00294B1511|nr:DUF2326 domain-containing protein [Halovibrio sp. HP20-59]MEA2118897.1 DUF2326 domain-containing protein [Halovibrio sp. HP20-59]